MRIMHEYSYERPATLDEAVRLLDAKHTVIAGGSDVLPQLKTATIWPEMLIDVQDIPELSVLEEREDGIHIGGMQTLSHIAKTPLIIRKVPAIGQGARNVASPQIRNRGTIAGNFLQARRCIYYNQTKEWRKGIPVCFKVGGGECLQIPKSPVCRAIYYSDVAPALLAYGAKAVIAQADGEHTADVWDLMKAHCEDRDELFILKEFFIPKENYEGAWSKFQKFSLRGGIDFPTINFACKYQAGKVRFFAGAIATYVLELEDLEAYLAEKGAEFSVDEAVGIADAEMKKKSQIVREAGITVKVKRGTFILVRELLEQLKNDLNG